MVLRVPDVTVEASDPRLGQFRVMFGYLLLNVGWPSTNHALPKWVQLDNEYKSILYNVFQYCLFPVNFYMGVHACPFCDAPGMNGIAVQKYGKQIHLGNGDIFVKGPNNLVFVAPTMIYHYIEKHHYCPHMFLSNPPVSSKARKTTTIFIAFGSNMNLVQSRLKTVKGDLILLPESSQQNAGQASAREVSFRDSKRLPVNRRI